MNLSYEILRFVDRVRRSPADANDPRLLSRLEKMARDGFDGMMVALHAPVAMQTWEARANLLGAANPPLTTRVPMVFPRPVEVVGMLPIVVATSANPGLVVPTVNDVDVSIDINSNAYLSSGSGVSSPAGGTTGQFITLANFSVLTPRLLMMRLTAPKPDIGFTFRWKRGTGVYQDALISVGVFARYLGGNAE